MWQKKRFKFLHSYSPDIPFDPVCLFHGVSPSKPVDRNPTWIDQNMGRCRVESLQLSCVSASIFVSSPCAATYAQRVLEPSTVSTYSPAISQELMQVAGQHISSCVFGLSQSDCAKIFVQISSKQTCSHLFGGLRCCQLRLVSLQGSPFRAQVGETKNVNWKTWSPVITSPPQRKHFPHLFPRRRILHFLVGPWGRISARRSATNPMYANANFELHGVLLAAQ